MKHVFVGFGFGPIQSGLFAKEAAESGKFSEIVVTEIDAKLVAAVRNNKNCYALNVAHADHVETVMVKNVTLLNPNAADDLSCLRKRLAQATEIVTSLPSVDFFTRGDHTAAARLIAEGLCRGDAEQTIVYTAENNNRAAEILQRDVETASAGAASQRKVQYLNTVIGKMSQVITNPDEIARRHLVPVTPGFQRAFLVESFNRILVSKIRLPGFKPGITAFEEKEDLLPFEEAKLYGHNAAHTMLGFLGALAGQTHLSDLRESANVMTTLRQAFVQEVGAALIARYGRINDTLFTFDGFQNYADDLLMRMTNPHLADTVARATRDPLRKLGRTDRIFGAVQLCLEEGVNPTSLAIGALAGLRVLATAPECPDTKAFAALRNNAATDQQTFEQLLSTIWDKDDHTPAQTTQTARLLVQAKR